MTHENEMERYRDKFLGKRMRRAGGRRPKAGGPKLFTLGFYAEIVFWLVMGAVLLSACAKAAI